MRRTLEVIEEFIRDIYGSTFLRGKLDDKISRIEEIVRAYHVLQKGNWGKQVDLSFVPSDILLIDYEKTVNLNHKLTILQEIISLLKDNLHLSLLGAETDFNFEEEITGFLVLGKEFKVKFAKGKVISLKESGAIAKALRDAEPLAGKIKMKAYYLIPRSKNDTQEAIFARKRKLKRLDCRAARSSMK